MELNKCTWCLQSELYENYHDQEWGFAVMEDAKLFEFLTLECFQAGLSWITILKKRVDFKIAFDDFNYLKIANYSDEKIKELLGNEKIIRHKGKILAAILNAKCFMEIQKSHGSFSNYIWGFVNHQPIINHPNTLKDVPSKTDLSIEISKDLKKRGFKFVGPTVIYAHMQATGMVNDHLISCPSWKKANDFFKNLK